MSPKRIGLLGGAFNPPHLGHVKLAEIALHELSLDQVRFVPTAISPHKSTDGPNGLTRLRLLVTALQTSGLPFIADPIELERPGPSYTVDTLEKLHHREPSHAWILLLGTDQAATFTEWRSPERILELASLAITHRPNHSAFIAPTLEHRIQKRWSGAPGEVVWLSGTDITLCSSKLRTDIAAGRIPDGLDPEVLAAILRENLYR